MPINTTDPNILRHAWGNFIEWEMELTVKINEAKKLREKTWLVELDSKHEKNQ